MRYRIAMISDFFYPRVGGVENHILNISKELRQLGHTIIIITHSNTGLVGVQEVLGFKTYYLDLLSIFGGAVFPTFFCTAAPIARILLNEQIDIVHGHQCTTLALEGVFHARMLGLAVCFTNHSLVQVNTLGGALTATAFQLSMLDAHQIICVSQASRINTAARLNIDPEKIAVIPNAVTDDFIPSPTALKPTPAIIITIAVVSRLTFRKGAVLLAETLPTICQLDERIRFIIAGDGDKRDLLEHTVDAHQLHTRVSFLGNINSNQVQQVLTKADLFLNTSLTDAFCISIVEAAACGLYVVSTNVDGISEVLPTHMITLTPATPAGIITGIKTALPKIAKYNKLISHQTVRALYRWPDIAQKTNNIYHQIYKQDRSSPRQKLTKSAQEMYRLRKHLFSPSFLLVFLLNYLSLFLLTLVYETPFR
ncbi:phosphatidylinositol N-acetylglucosaminyltransferase subunit A [Nematocida homosporus]|uniref:phosphatidylinositol N-acetylglucosaminyltransferase subunit A n=1 Tax=Nematocida homosporus TaxID=1912981 RepID=UPI00221EDAAB|nr:phosphatidylinositol N-acetylglucosaminyltransferase subunit A [Nematocida homosporus]KAI5187270.1 phosphatidylinositol N-acetylglucosaminyltransferase subunit A [Nematocida homosporus]